MNNNYFSKLCHSFAPTTIKSKLPRLICLNNNRDSILYILRILYILYVRDICCVVKRVCQGGLLNNKWLQILREIFIIQILCSLSQSHINSQARPVLIKLPHCRRHDWKYLSLWRLACNWIIQIHPSQKYRTKPCSLLLWQDRSIHIVVKDTLFYYLSLTRHYIQDGDGGWWYASNHCTD